jgi:hypothetical protein
MKAQYGPPVKRKIPFYVNEADSGDADCLVMGKGMKSGRSGWRVFEHWQSRTGQERLAGKHGTLHGFWSHHTG